jgi:hypothetical protein
MLVTISRDFIFENSWILEILAWEPRLFASGRINSFTKLVEQRSHPPGFSEWHNKESASNSCFLCYCQWMRETFRETLMHSSEKHWMQESLSYRCHSHHALNAETLVPGKSEIMTIRNGTQNRLQMVNLSSFCHIEDFETEYSMESTPKSPDPQRDLRYRQTDFDRVLYDIYPISSKTLIWYYILKRTNVHRLPRLLMCGSVFLIVGLRLSNHSF